jgi:hypothetical protein
MAVTERLCSKYNKIYVSLEAFAATEFIEISWACGHINMRRFSDVSGTLSPSSGRAGGLVEPELMTKCHHC